MGKSSLIKKLQIKPEYRIVIINPPPGYMKNLRPLPEGVVVADQPKGAFDFVQLFVKNIAELNRFGPRAIRAVKPDGLFWISYPKRSSKFKSDLSRDEVWEVMAKTGLKGVTLVSIDDVWSAMRFRPSDRVGEPTKE
jgi:hypothetical protein